MDSYVNANNSNSSASKEQEEKDKKMEEEVKSKLISQMNDLIVFDEFESFDLININQDEYMRKVEENGLENDDLMKGFIKLVSTSTNFASSNFKQRVKHLPQLISEIKDLIYKMKQEIKKYTDIAVQFEELIQIFIRLVMETKHNMKMVKPHLKSSVNFIY